MWPNVETTRSKLPSANGSSSASPSTHSISRPSASAFLRPASRSSGVRSSPVTAAPRRAAGRAAGPAGHVQDPHPRLHRGPSDDRLADVADQVREEGVVAGAPDRALVLL